jgi:uncharacterized cofD-like protein
MKKSNKKIVVIGGGTGVYTVLTGLKNYFEDLTAVVTMADDGGSTGILREEFGILPPGDVRRALVALSASDNKMLSELFSYRFQEGAGLTGHTFGNLMLTALERLTGNFENAIEEAGKILVTYGRVVPVTLQRPRLFAQLENGQVIKGESNINIPQHDGYLKIKRVWLKPAVSVNPNAKKAILESDAVVLCPGDVYTSLIPNLLVKGVREALKKTKGKVIYFTNLMTKFGETNHFRASDFVSVVSRYLGNDVLDYVVVNSAKPNPRRLSNYVKEKSDFVEPDFENFKKLKIKAMLIKADLIRTRGFLRHDPEKLARVVKMII